MKEALKAHCHTADAISRLLHPFAEVVIHSLEKDEIEAIFNPISNRQVGDSSYLDKIDFKVDGAMPNIIGPYEKMNYDGRKLKSISIVLRDDDATAIGFLCINIDVSVFDKYQSLLSTFLLSSSSQVSGRPDTLFRNDWYEKINTYVQSYCIDNSVCLESLSRTHKKQLILKLKEEGALGGKNASHYIARTLRVSRATVYNYLKEQTSL